MPRLHEACARGRADRRTACFPRALRLRRFRRSYTVQGVAALLKRHGWSCQVPARRSVERDENVMASWMKETWPQGEGPWRRSTHGSSSRTKADSR
ncbi:helix-turn-helix domain-containing protein [Streptomyces sp. NPDC000229]|uniref:helix-turn-helix domain-containing protein n=1 Tax=Streptomyces sp. NPDC000229 TaxID=3154247 RepID=UPI00332A5DD8